MTNIYAKRLLAVALSLSMTLQGSFGAVPSVLASEAPSAEDVVVLNGETQDSIVVAQDALTGLTNFSSPQGGLVIDEENHTVTIQNNNDNHYAVYEGLEKKANSFVLETDVKLTDENGNGSAAIIFGLSRKNAPGSRWSGANFDTGRGGDDVFRMFGPDLAAEVMCGTKEGVDFTQPVHLKLDIDKDGNYTYSFGNTGTELREQSGQLSGWTGGFVGLLTWSSEATFSNITFEDRTVEEHTDTDPLEIDERFHTNLAGLSTLNGSWEVTDDGLHSNAVDKGDAFMYSSTKASDFVYSTDVKLLSDGGAASLLFRSDSATGHANSYAVNLDAGSKACKFWRWTDGDASQLINEKTVEATADGVYNLKVVAIGTWVSYYVNDTLIASSGDYTLQPDDRGQDTCYVDGFVGLLNWNGDMVFQNTFVEPIEGAFDPTLSDITVTSSTGTVEGKAQFNAHEPIFIQYVKNDATTVDINATSVSSRAAVLVKDAQGNVYPDGKNVPVEVGRNYIDVISSVTKNDGNTVSLTYRVNVHRRQVNAIYYNEPFRDQYHYSVKDGWGNDPNGMVYYKGTYHFFYQFFDDVRWGPMHWAHATSTDLIHWTEEPMALYPDANGAMFSGCAVVDDTNVSGLFSTDEGGLVALITADGNGQRIKLAYSEDEGKTWTKVDKVVADWSRDPLGSMDFRDPKVFRWEGKWFMVIAGGPLRIYSSENLVDWKCESTYANLHTECPDMYPITASDGTLKWVLSRGGRLYKVGDFKEVDGNWTFVPDSEYQDADGVMNFGKD
ncbi:MAG: cadherin-like beta sandwich domain-containing protein, partial [Atopobiaceae bacterium]|nr:cadherin-like beta sandwich domain-containing protein [Atopobiaceae bacterium]